MASDLSQTVELTPQERLAVSRKAIVRHMTRDDHDKNRAAHAGEDETPADDEETLGKWGLFKRAARTWWRHHPANMALDLAAPVVGTYARNHPFRVLGIAAAVGALAVVVKPWKLVSLGGLALATVKSSDITGVVLSMLMPSKDTESESPNNFSDKNKTHP